MCSRIVYHVKRKQIEALKILNHIHFNLLIFWGRQERNTGFYLFICIIILLE